ncbi:MAG: DUF853 family protein [Planctomycetota bacterium]
MVDRIAAFCSSKSPEVFQSVAYQQQVWTPDPFDVEDIHGNARDAFERLLNRATTPGENAVGKVLLLKGESGCGKTHLMRVFRNRVHQQGSGYVGYLQMTSVVENYARYMLANLVDSLDKPYDGARGPMSGLRRLSNAIAESPDVIPPAQLEELREADLTGGQLGALVSRLADRVILQGGLGDLDLDLIRALFYLQRDDPRIKGRVLRYLRCQDLSMPDRAILGGLVPRKREEDAAVLIEQLGTLIAHVENGSLVLCIDQLEDIYNLDKADAGFRRAIGAVCEFVNRTPSSIAVISCLEDYYEELSAKLPRSLKDRIENDPEPVVLASARSKEEIARMIEQRLFCLYDETGASLDDSDPTFPFTQEAIAAHENMRSRDVLDWCRLYRERCIAAGDIVSESREESGPKPPVDREDEKGTEVPVSSDVDLAQAWNDALRGDFEVPVEESDLAKLFAWGIEAVNSELCTGHSLSVSVDDNWLDVSLRAGEALKEELCLGFCNKRAQGGGLSRQVTDLERRTKDRRLVILRTVEYPSSPKAKITLQIGELIARGGRRILVEDSDWRAMLAMQQFEALHKEHPHFARWRRTEKPLSSMPSLTQAFRLDELVPVEPRKPDDDEVKSDETIVDRPSTGAGEEKQQGGTRPVAPPDTRPSDEIVLGHSKGLRPEPVSLTTSDLTRHAVFLGGSGSGKTTLALNLIENLVERGVPALLIDRKGDLCSYAQPSAWEQPLADPEDVARRKRLRERVDVAVYTPGNPAGCPLSIPIVADDLGKLPAHERDQQAKFAATALGEMLGFSAKSRRDAAAIALLGTAIGIYAKHCPDQKLGLDELLHFIQSKDRALVMAVGCLDEKLFDKLAQDLQTLKLSNGQLFSAEHERLDVQKLLGLDRKPEERTRLSVISTKFLGDTTNVLFWVAQLLGEVYQTVSKRPSDRLQAVLMLDEADLYLPAQSKPATKEPMENLLKRARSAGLGVLLATQSPGDLDYKCRDNIRSWFVGRVREQTALNKMKPMLMDSPIDITSELPGQGPGQFHLLSEKRVIGFQADRNLVPAEQVPEDEILELARTRSLHPVL